MRVHINFKLRSNVDCIETCLLTGESLNELFWTPPTPRGAGSPAGSQGKMFLCHDILSPKANAETSILLLVNPCFEMLVMESVADHTFCCSRSLLPPKFSSPLSDSTGSSSPRPPMIPFDPFDDAPSPASALSLSYLLPASFNSS
jgi:hypothetical protein